MKIRRSKALKYILSERLQPDHKFACGQALVYNLHPRSVAARMMVTIIWRSVKKNI